MKNTANSISKSLKLVCLLSLSGYLFSVRSEPIESLGDDLIHMSLEELLDMEIRAASGKAEKLRRAPLDSTVITRQ